MTEKLLETKSLWAWVPAGLLGSMLCGLGTLAYIATDDPHFALEPNYYDKAVHWDQARSEARQSDATGFRAELDALVTGGDGRLEVRIRLVDGAGQPLRSAHVQVEAFPNAYASRVSHLELREAEPGTYVAWLERPVTGLWELRLEAFAGSHHFRETLRRDVLRAGKS